MAILLHLVYALHTVLILRALYFSEYQNLHHPYLMTNKYKNLHVKTSATTGARRLKNDIQKPLRTIFNFLAQRKAAS